MEHSFNISLFLIVCFAWISDFAVRTETEFGLANELDFDQRFEDGMSAFVTERWHECVFNLEAALNSHETVRDLQSYCQLNCQNKDGITKMMDADVKERKMQGLFSAADDNSQLSAKLAVVITCSKQCENDFSDDFDRLKAFSVLQHCYFQNKMHQKAASAVYTIVRARPGDKKMLSQLRFYIGLPEVDQDQVVDLELPPSYVAQFERASAALGAGRYSEAIELTENSLDGFLKAEARCRVRCEHQDRDGELESRYAAPASVAFVDVMACHQRCSEEVTGYQDNMMPLLYQYLHYAYLNVGKIREAVEAAASFVLLSPHDARALATEELYKSLLNLKDVRSKARKEAKEYVSRRQHEAKILQLINILHSPNHGSEKSFNEYSNEVEENEDKLQTDGSEGSSSTKDCTSFASSQETSDEGMDNVLREQIKELFCKQKNDMWTHSIDLLSDTSKKDLARHFEMPKATISKGKADANALRDAFLQDVKLVKTGEELLGKSRFVAEGLATEDECKAMVQLAQVGVVPGGGHGGNPMPFSKLETHSSMSIGKGAQLVYSGVVQPEAIETLIEIGDRAKAFLERHFGLKKKLHFAFTDLVCRTSTVATLRGAHPDALSHPVHADNCIESRDGVCIHHHPNESLRWRAYSTLVYLNEDFEGGELFFAANRSSNSVQSTVHAKCGRLVGFTSGTENLHGVRGVRNGRRCAVATWFTTAHAWSERDRRTLRSQLDANRLNAGLL